MNEPSDHLIRIDWKPILLWGGGVGGLMGLWWGCWLVGFLVAIERGLLYPGIEIPPDDPNFLLFSTETSLRWLGDVLGIEIPKNLSSVFLSIVAIGWALGAGIASLGRFVRLDPNLCAWKTLRWSLRGMLSPMVLLACSAVPTISGILFVLESNRWDDSLIGIVAFTSIAGGILVFWYIGVPLLVCRMDIAMRFRVPNQWRPLWPGWKPVAVFLGLALLTEAPGVLLWLGESRFESSLQASVVLAVTSFAWSLVLIVVPLVQCAVLMGCAEGVFATWRRLFSWTYLGPWIALGGWWCAATPVIVPPVLAGYVWLWKFLPLAATIHESQGSLLPYTIQLFVNSLHFFGNFWWVFLAVPLAFVFWLSASRLLVLVEATRAPRTPSPGDTETA